MKHITFVFLLSFFIGHSYAQDTIIKINSDKIIAKIIEITPTEVKYKKFDFQDGPLYVEKKSDIKMVIYSNGLKEVFQTEVEKPAEKPIDNGVDYYGGKTASTEKLEAWGSRYRYQNRYINERQMHNILLDSKDKKIIALVSDAKTAKGMQYIGFAAIPLGIAALGLFGSSLNIDIYGNSSVNSGKVAGGAVCLIAAIACPITSGIFKRNRKNYNRTAVKLYNEKF